MKDITQGTRYSFTKRHFKQTETKADLVEASEVLSTPPSGSDLDRLERFCRNVFHVHGLPTDDRRFAYRLDASAPNGFVWAEYPDNHHDAEGWGLHGGVRWIASGANPLVEIDSRLGYAARILDLILWAKDAAERGNFERAMDCALNAGMLIEECQFADFYAAEKKKGASASNSPREAARQKYIETARALWANDTYRELRMGDVIRHCRTVLDAEGLPTPSDKSMRTNLHKAGIVPDYASRGGRISE